MDAARAPRSNGISTSNMETATGPAIPSLCSAATGRVGENGTGPAGIQVRGCVDVRVHTREACEPRAVRSCVHLPTALSSSSSSLSVSDSCQKNCPQLSNRPHKLRPCFQVPTDSQGLWGAHKHNLMSNISATRGRPDMRFCVCGSPRGDLSHIAGLTLGLCMSDFSGDNRRAQDHTCGRYDQGRTDTTNCLSENHL